MSITVVFGVKDVCTSYHDAKTEPGLGWRTRIGVQRGLRDVVEETVYRMLMPLVPRC
jgi:hypothetical protein